MKIVHVLNGDALLKRFPKEIEGEKVVFRECLVDGDVKSENWAELFQKRANYLSQTYSVTIEEYQQNVISELKKFTQISKNSQINFWFEDDLFCQVNFWFSIHFIAELSSKNIFLVRPKILTQYGFGALNKEELISVYQQKIHLTEIKKISKLWANYQNHNLEKLLEIAKELKEYPFILEAVKAHILRFPVDGTFGMPKQTLVEIMNDLNTKEFGKVFQEFCKRKPIYGFGDLLVKRLYTEVLEM